MRIALRCINPLCAAWFQEWCRAIQGPTDPAREIGGIEGLGRWVSLGRTTYVAMRNPVRQSPRTSKGYAAVSRARASAILVFDKAGRRHPSVTAVCISYCTVNVGSKP